MSGGYHTSPSQESAPITEVGGLVVAGLVVAAALAYLLWHILRVA